MSKPAPDTTPTTIDLSPYLDPVKAAIAAVQTELSATQQTLTDQAVTLAAVQARLTKLETPTPVSSPSTPAPGQLSTTTTTTTTTTTSAPAPTVPAVPHLDLFEAVMIDNTQNGPTVNGSYGGGYWAAQILAATDLYQLAVNEVIYYDATRVYYQIADYTQDAKWNAVAQKANDSYLALLYANPATPGAAQGFQVFPRGLFMDWQRTGNPKSKQAIIDMANNAAWQKAWPCDGVGPCWPNSWMPGLAGIREASYALMNRLYAKDVDPSGTYGYAGYVTFLRQYWAQALWMLQNKTAEGIPTSLAPDPLGPGDRYIRPFMMGVSAEALIEFYTRSNQPWILPTIQPVLELMWAYFDPKTNSFPYSLLQNADGTCPWTADNSDDNCPSQPTPTLNMLIAPAYAWVYSMTKDATWRDRADALFAGIQTANYQTGLLATPAGKGFNQAYKWFPEYLKWRQ